MRVRRRLALLLSLLFAALCGAPFAVAAQEPAPWFERFEMRGAQLPGEPLEDPDGAFANDGTGLIRTNAGAEVSPPLRLLRTRNGQFRLGSWQFIVDLTILPDAPADVIHIGLGSGRTGPHGGAPTDGLAVRLHQGGRDGNDTGYRVDLVSFDGPSAYSHFERLGSLPPGPLPARLHVDMVKLDEQLTVSFTSANVNFAKIIYRLGELAPELAPDATHLYVGSSGSAVRFDSLYFKQMAEPPPPPQLQLQLLSGTLRPGDQALLSWSTQNADYCSATGDWRADLATHGQRLSEPLYNRDNTLTVSCEGRGGRVSASAHVQVEGGRDALTPLLSGDLALPGLDPLRGQHAVKVGATDTGRVVVMYAQGFAIGCALFEPCRERGETWHLVADARGIVTAPRRTWPALDALPGLNNGSLYPFEGHTLGDGNEVAYALTHSGHNALGGNLVLIDGQGNVTDRLRGNNSYTISSCAVGQDPLILTTFVDPNRPVLTRWSKGEDRRQEERLEAPLVGLGRITCAHSPSLQRPVIVSLRDLSSLYELQAHALQGNSVVPFGPPVRVPASRLAPGEFDSRSMAMGDDMGVLVLRDRAPDGRTDLRFLRFRATARGVSLVDERPRPLLVSPLYEGRDVVVTYGGNGRFYLASFHAGNPAREAATVGRQAVHVFALDFAQGTPQQLTPPWEDDRWSGTPLRNFYGHDMLFRHFSIAKSCDGAVYVGGAVDNGEGRGLLKLFRLAVEEPSCGATPQLRPVVKGTQGQGLWYTSDVELSWTVDLRGERELQREGCEALRLTQDTAGSTYRCRIVTTGGERQQSVTVQRDATAPLAEFNLRPLPNPQGWHAGPVTIEFRGRDATSGIAQCSAADVIRSEGDAQHSIEGRCTDQAGNVSDPVQASGIRIDRTAPSVQARAMTTPNGDDWYSAPVTVLFSATDALSGVAADGCDAPARLARSGRDQAASGRCRDRAGNSNEGRISGVNIDLAAPLATVSVTPLANAAGWHREVPTVRFDGIDRMSGAGIARCTAPVRVSHDVTARQVRGHCTDKAGHASTEVIEVINLDRLAPSVQLRLPAQGSRYARGSTHRVDFSCSDERSGIERCEAPRAAGALLDTSQPGDYSFAVTATDQAGNTTLQRVAYRVE